MTGGELDPRIRRALDTFNDRALDDHMDEFVEGATFLDPFLDEPVTGDAHREYFEDVIEAFPDIVQTEHRVVTDGDVTVLESTFSGTHEGPLEGIPPTGESVSVPLVSVIEVSDEGITAWRDYWDRQEFREQLGLTFPEVVGHLPRFVRWKLVG